MRVMAVVFFASSLLAASGVEAISTNGIDSFGVQVYVEQSEREPTEAERLKWKMYGALPYGGGGEMVFHQRRTLGQLAKLCDCTAVVTVSSIRVLPDKKKAGASSPGSEGINIALSVRVEQVLFGTVPRILFGTVPRKKLTVTADWPDLDAPYGVALLDPYSWNWKPRPKKGDRLLVFLSDTPVSEFIGYAHEFNFDFQKQAEPGKPGHYLLRGGGGARFLDTPENTAAYLNAAKGYLKELRGEARDADSYYTFLSGLVQSPVRSIREDARSDLMFLARTCPDFDARRLLSDDRIDPALKYWAEHEQIPIQEKQRAERKQKAQQP